MKPAVRRRKSAAPARPERARPLALRLPPREATALAWSLPLLVTIAVHGQAVRTFFAADDVTFLSRASGIAPTPWTLARPLSEGVTWHLLYAAFRLNPLPYHLFLFALHLVNTALVFAIARRLTGGLGAACAAAVLFGASAIVFTPLHWTSCLVELQVSTFTLAAFLVYLRARDGAKAAEPAPPRVATDPQAAGVSRPLIWLSALLGLAAVLSKESVILFPLAFLVADRRSGLFTPHLRTVIPGAIAAAGYGLAFALLIRTIKYVGTEAYGMTASPSFLMFNFATYLRWLVALTDPLPDLKAVVHTEALATGAMVALAALVLLAISFRAKRHPEEVGAAWFLIFLLPVVPLEHHTYLYYLYLPWAGACWTIAAAGQRLVNRAPLPLAIVAALALVGFAALQARAVRARESRMSGYYPADRTIRDSMILKNIVGGLDTLGYAPGTAFVFANPAPRVHRPLAGSGPIVYSYMPFDAALRDGETLRLFAPTWKSLDVVERVPREWEDREIVLFNGDGKLWRIGRGGRALTELGYRLMPLGIWAPADSMFRRARALGDTLPDGTFGLMATSHYLGHDDVMREFCREFLRRWPNEPRAAVVDSALEKSLRGTPLAR